MKKFDVVIFDLDSTLVKIEGLDWLAQRAGKGNEVKKLTKKSMEGLLNVEEAMKKKMKIIAPSYDDLVILGKKYCTCIGKDAKEVIGLLHLLGKEVRIVTGNFQPAAGIVGKKLGIASDKIIANEVYFGKDGEYKGFNDKNPLSKNGGKAKVIKEIIKRNFKTVFVGDGVTDLEAKQCVDLFVGYGGVVVREVVKSSSKLYIESKSMLPLLDYILTHEEKTFLKDLYSLKK